MLPRTSVSECFASCDVCGWCTAQTNAGILLVDNMQDNAKEQDTTPDVPPKEMAEAIKDLKLRFGNIDENFDTGYGADTC